ncbi:MAG: twin-arginine translocase TatA/TatE family subunit [Anaerolineales bacterium]|jgi:sec-independent protein translocase protein TatA
MRFGGWELVIVLAIVVLVFGVGRISKIGGELGSGIKAFKDGLQGDDEEEKDQDPDQDQDES